MTITNTSPATAVDSRPHKAAKLKPFTVRRHDMWAAGHAPVHRAVAIAQPRTQAPVAGHALAATVQVLGAPFRWIARAWRMQGEILSLDVLDDHLLRDMGLTRSEIRAAIRAGQHPHPDRPGEYGSVEHP